MKDILKTGMTKTIEYDVTKERTVPYLYPDVEEFVAIPEVFATGYMIGLMELCCIRALAPALEPGEGSLGTYVQSSHTAATSPGHTVKVHATIVEIDGRRVRWNVIAEDAVDEIGRGVIERTVVFWDRFNDKLDEKNSKTQLIAQRLGVG